MRRANAETVRAVLYQAPALTLAAVAKATGLSRRTVELILIDLERDGWIQTRPPELGENGRGRPARQFEFRAGAGAVLAVDIAHDRSTATVADLRGTEIIRQVADGLSEAERDDRLARTRQAVAGALEQAGLRPEDLGAVCVATPGNVNDAGAVDVGLSMRGWVGFSLREEIARDFSCPVLVENNAKLAVRAELWDGGATPGADHVLWLMLEGRYNGMSIVVNGEPYRGVDGAAGEIFWAKTLGFDELTTSPLIGLGSLQPPEQARAAQQILASARAGEPGALAEVERLVGILGHGVSTLAWVLAPRYVVLGGALNTALGDLLAPRLSAVLKDLGPPFTEIRRSALGDSVVSRGAVRAALGAFDWSEYTPLQPASQASSESQSA
nr:ROK family transcriptional regulator [Kineosporia babensis]